MSEHKNSDVFLRPRFSLDYKENQEALILKFKENLNAKFSSKIIDNHIIIDVPSDEDHFWSPQLHLEITDIEEGGSKLYGLFGPNPTLWTFFMFLHFGVATIFIGLGVWGYSSASLGRGYGLQLGLMIFMILLWFVLYAFGRAGRSKGKPQMHELHNFMNQRLGL